MFLSGEMPQGSACTTNDVSAMIEDLQYTLGEGPGVDAHRGGTRCSSRIWLRQAGHVGRVRGPGVAGGAKAVFGFPVRVGAPRLGALSLYRDRRRPAQRRATRRRPGDGRRGRPGRPLHASGGRPGHPRRRARQRSQSPFESSIRRPEWYRFSSGSPSARRWSGYAATPFVPTASSATWRTTWSTGGCASASRLTVERPTRYNLGTASLPDGLARTPHHRSLRFQVGVEVPQEAVLLRTIVDLADSLVDDFDIVELLTLLSDGCVEALDVAAAGVMLGGPSGVLQVVASSSETMRDLELFQLQST